MKTKIILFGLLTSLISCSSQNSGIKKNEVLGTEVKIWYVAGLDNPQSPKEWLSGLELDKLMKIAFTPILEGRISVYSPDQKYFVNKKVAVVKIKDQLGWTKGITNYSELRELFFHEKWEATTDLKSFKKEVVFWCPVQVWSPNGSAEVYKRLSFYVKPNTLDKGEIVAKSIFTEFDFSNPSNYPYWSGFDPLKYVNSVIDHIQNNSLKAYDPVHLVDNSFIHLTSAELEKLCGLDLGSVDLRNIVSSFIFEENWYISPTSLNICKEVKSIGFVKKYWVDGQQQSKILFFLKLE